MKKLLSFTFAAGLLVAGAVLADDYKWDPKNFRETHQKGQKFTTEGTLLAQWGSFGSGDGQFNDPRGVAVDAAGNIYVVDSVNQRVQKFGYLPTPAKRTTWGGLKQIYR